MKKLLHCAYPTAAQKSKHGIQPLPARLPIAKIPPLEVEGELVSIRHLTKKQLAALVKIVAESFAQREPMVRHLFCPGPYSKAELLAAFIEECILPKEDAQEQSFALVRNGHVLGGAFNETLVMDTADSTAVFEGKIARALDFLSPILDLLQNQDAASVALLSSYPKFKKALREKRVGHHFMVARGVHMSGDQAFDLVSGTMAQYRKMNFGFVITEATNEWTGAAVEAMGGVRVHFAPYRDEKIFGVSEDGFMSDKDSGSMLYILRLK